MQEAQSSDAGEGSETGSAEFNNDEVLGYPMSQDGVHTRGN